MITEDVKSNNANPFIVILNIFKYAFVGLKYISYELWVDLYNGASYRVDKTYQSTKQAFMTEEDKIYERTKRKVKKEKVYKYSAKTLAKLEQEKERIVS